MLTKEEGRKNLPLVIERFRRWKSEGRLLKNEDDVKTLIEELFEKVLGWDKDDMYRERHPGPNSKRADFQFKDKGIIKLILETKALDVQWTGNVKKQAIGYGWSANKEYVVLTNFQSLILFNAKWKDEDKRIFEIENIEDCLSSEQKFDFLWLLSKESFITGKIDEFSESIGKKLKKAEISTIDKQLLNDLKKWREMLTKDIKSLNELSEEKIDEIVQKIINRFIFIRACEDRGLSPTITDMLSYLRLWQEKRAKSLLEHLLFIFHHYDDVYDGTIFQKNDPCEKIQIHNNTLEKIIEQLYIAEGLNVEYNFAFIDADVLGSVYEEYLGYLLKGKKITENHAHRKEQGIYYTPTYIVDYIVRNTLGEVLKQSKEIDKIKVLDPACGSGSFLIKTFDVISEFYKEKIGEEKFNRQIKNSILTNNIYGVDLDPKAVEIAQLNLFLKIGEKGGLPKLRENIKCGNSIIDDNKISNKAFKWEQEFEDIMKEGGFDIIIGNPPYGAELNEVEREFISSRYEIAKSYKNTALIFIEKSVKLLKDRGYLGLIVPKSLAYSQAWKPCRDFIKDDLILIVDVSKAFEDVLLEQVIFVLKKGCKSKKYEIVNILDNNKFSIQKEYITKTDSIILHDEEPDLNIFKKIVSLPTQMKDISKTFRGLPLQKYVSKTKSKYKVFRGINISRYYLSDSSEYLQNIDSESSKIKSLLQPKIISQRIVAHVTKPKEHIIIMSTLDKDGITLNLDTVENTIITDRKYQLETILAILNSNLVSWYSYRYIFAKAIRTMDFDDYYIGKIPIPVIPKKIETNLINLVNKMISLTDEKKKTEEEIKKTDKEINDLIYKIYGITDEEKKIIEDSLK
jgi:predicted RNA methylase